METDAVKAHDHRAAAAAARGANASRLVRYRQGDEVAWGVLDDACAAIWHVAGGLSAWAPRIANGEAISVLPRTGRRVALSDVELLPPLEPSGRLFVATPSGDFARIETSFAGLATREGRPVGLAIVGAPLTGRRNLLRCLLGYGLGWRAQDGKNITVAAAVVPRSVVGDADPALETLWSAILGEPAAPRGRVALTEQLRGGESAGLRCGDGLLFEWAAASPGRRRVDRACSREG